jgi:hypothetical protein
MHLELPRDRLRQVALHANVALPGLYAWVTTVAHPVAAHRGLAARVAAYAALLALLLGTGLLSRRPRAARALGVLAFVGLCVITWLLLGQGVDSQQLSPIRAGCGAVGWALYAFGWGSVWPAAMQLGTGDQPADEAPLAPRSRLPRGAGLILLLAVAAALGPWLWAWTVVRPDHAVLAHAVALLGALALLSAAARVALERDSPRGVAAPQTRLRAAAGPLSALALVLVAGLLWRLLL